MTTFKRIAHWGLFAAAEILSWAYILVVVTKAGCELRVCWEIGMVHRRQLPSLPGMVAWRHDDT